MITDADTIKNLREQVAFFKAHTDRLESSIRRQAEVTHGYEQVNEAIQTIVDSVLIKHGLITDTPKLEGYHDYD